MQTRTWALELSGLVLEYHLRPLSFSHEAGYLLDLSSYLCKMGTVAQPFGVTIKADTSMSWFYSGSEAFG